MRLCRAGIWILLLFLVACSSGGGGSTGSSGTPITVGLAPSSVQLQAGQAQLFLATVGGTSNSAVTWSVDEPGGGQVSSAGQYVAPQAAGTFHVRATSQADATKSAQATVTVTAPPVVAVTVTPAAVALLAGQQQAFTATVTGSANTAVTWTVVEAGGGSVNGAGNYTAPATAGSFHVRATSVADATKSAQATITVTAPPVVTVTMTPAAMALQIGQQQAFTATVTGSANPAVTWTVVEAGGGSVSASGNYTAPATAGTFHVRATSVADVTKSAQATVTVTAPPVVAVTLTPPSVALQTGQQHAFTATVTGSANNAVIWSVVEAGGGSVSASGVYTAPASAGSFQVRATSVADATKSAQATVTVTAPPVVAVTLTPPSVALQTGQQQSFSALVTGSSNTSVTWMVLEVGGGGVSTAGLYTAPAIPGSFHVRATSQADASKWAQATVTVTAPPVVAVTLTPAAVALQTGQQQAFSAAVTGSANTGVTWAVLEVGGGSISASGIYNAPATAGSFHVRATSLADASRWAEATVAVTAPPAVAVTVTPPTVALQAGQQQPFSAAVTGSANTGVTWSVVEAGGGGVSASGMYTAPATAGSFHVRATSVADASKWAQATVTVTAVVAVTVTPEVAVLQTGQQQMFTATVTGSANTAVTWAVVEAGGGSVDGAGNYTAPATTGTFHVRATSQADTTKSAQATVTVTAPAMVAVTVTPAAVALQTGQPQAFTATVTGSANTAVTWAVVEAGGGSVDGAGNYKAPAAAGTFHVRATSVADATKSDQATVTVTAAPMVAVTVTPTAAALQTGQPQAFTATVTGSANTAVTWAVVEAGGGSVDGAGNYTAPAATGTFHVRATSQADTTKSAQATVTVTAPAMVAVTVTPAAVVLQTGQPQTFTATVTGSANTAVTWAVVEAGGGSVDGAGNYTAPATAGTFHVRATSVGDATKSALATVTVTAPQLPSGYLMLTSARLMQIRSEAAAGGSAWANLKANVDAHLASADQYDTGPENMALAYLVSGDARYAARAYWWAEQRMAQNLRRDSYYDFGEILEGVAMVLNYCAPALSGTQLATLADYLEAAADELWYHNAGSGWGLDNPRNNYHHTFLMGTAFAGYALKAKGDPRGDRWIALVKDLLEKPGGVMAYLNTGVPGGDWDEGVNYAEGSKMHLARTLAIIAAAGGINYFAATPFFQNLSKFSLYSLQPGGHFIYPGGDLSRDSSMPLTPYDRALLQPVMAWLSDSDGRRLGQWLLNHAMPTYLDGDRTFSFRTGLYLDVLFKLNLVEAEPNTQPLAYRTATTNWVNLRSGWDPQATSLSISGSPRIFESHQHMDSGSFTLWKGGWQAVDASTYSHSGLLQVPEAHNLLRVPHAQWLNDETVQMPGLTRFSDYGPHAYVQVDATRLYRWALSSSDIRDLLNEHTRELVYLRPNTLVVFDRVDARSDGQGFAWCLHFPTAPTYGSGRYSAAFEGGGMSLVKLLGGASSVVSDGDLEPGTSSVRVEEAATGVTSRFLNVLEVASGSAPTTTAQLVSTAGSVSGAVVGTTVVLFSDRPRGAPAALPFSYTLAGTGTLTHLLCNLAAPVSVTAVASGGNTVVTVSAGSTYSPDAQGTVQFAIAPIAGISVSVSPSTASVNNGASQAFTATVTGTAITGVTWSVIEPGGGSVSAAGLYTAPGMAGTFHVRATSNADGSRFGEATVTVTAPPVITVTVSPAVASLFTGATQAFTATVTGTANTAVTWSVVEPGGGSLSAGGLYTAPATAGSFHVRAASQANPAASGQATVTVAAVPPAGPCNAADLGAGASLHGYRPFPADNPWNQDISGSAVDPNSATIIAFIGGTRGLKADFGSGLWEGAPIGIPYQVVDAAQAKVRINFTAYGDESDPGPMPIPAAAPIEGGVSSTGDRHVLVMDRAACILYELYRAFPQGDGSWNADSAAIWDLKSNNLRPFGWTSADAAGLPLFPGLARYDEVAAGEITHALRFTVPTTRRAYVLPATHWASSTSNTNTPPMGMRVRLKASVDISGYSTPVQVILRALKKYGMILADNGSAWYISGAPDERWNNSQLAAMGNIKGSDLEVVQMGTVFTADPGGAAPVIASFTAGPASIASGGSSTLSWSASNATRFLVTPEAGWVTGSSVAVRPAATTTYTLTAEGPYGSATRTVTVTVTAPQPPSITAFTAAPAVLTAGQSSTLAWSVAGASSLSLDRGIGTVTGSSIAVTPAATTTYTLTASNSAGSMTATATVTVSSGMHYLVAYNSGPAAPFGLQNSWIREAWEGTPPVATNLVAAAPSRPGTQSLEVAFGPGNSWNALGLAHRLDWSNIHWLFFNQFRTIEFDLQFAADSTGEDNLVFILEDGGHADERALTSFIPAWSALTAAQKRESWFHVTVDLAALHPRPGYSSFERWLLFNNADASVSRPHFFLSDVKLGWVDDSAPPVITFGAAGANATSTELSLAWSTDEATIRVLEWGPTPAYGHTVAGGTAAGDYTTSHTATLAGLSPGLTCYYRIIARDHQFQAGTAQNQGTLAGSFSMPAAPVTPPIIAGLSASSVGAVTATLAWSTDRPCSERVSYRKAAGPTLTRSLGDLASARTFLLDLLEPSTSYTVTIVATDAFGNDSAPATLLVTTTATGAADVTVTIDPTTTHAISPWIYGINFYGSVAGAPPRLTLNRMGGNRWTAYNWENNASNAGSDWGPYSNDGYLGGGTTPAEAVRSGIAADQANGMASLMTIQLQGYVSADKNGLVNIGDPNHLANRFKQVVFKKGSAFTATPGTADANVYMDEFLWALRAKFTGDIFGSAAASPTFVSLDNEPELWGDTHAEIQTGLITPAAYIQKTIALAKALKDVAPGVQLFGPVHYGFNGIVNWQNSPGFTSSYWFTDKYLEELRIASEADGRRLLDAYDLHWYSEATGDGTRITNLSATTLTANQVQAIVQSPRSLWDPTYTENSWVAQYLGQPVNLLGRLQAKIAVDWPGTRIAITEYGNGGDNHIAGALAQADNLGIFGAYDVFAANLWPLNDCPFILAGFRAFRGFDGGSASFGDVSLKATSSSVQSVAAYVSLDSQVPGRVVIVAINRGTMARTVAFQGQPLAGTASIYRITADSGQAQRAATQPVAPILVGQVPVAGSTWTVVLPPLSVSTVDIQ